jgi:hypothetical protein
MGDTASFFTLHRSALVPFSKISIPIRRRIESAASFLKNESTKAGAALVVSFLIAVPPLLSHFLSTLLMGRSHNLDDSSGRVLSAKYLEKHSSKVRLATPSVAGMSCT